MSRKEQAIIIDKFLNSLLNSPIPLSFSDVFKDKNFHEESNIQKFREIEDLIEELGLVKLIRGRDNSTPNGQCEYLINKKGKKVIENKKSIFDLILKSDLKSFPPFNSKEIEKNELKLIEKRVEEADFLFDIIISEKLIKLNKKSIKKLFKEWFIETKDFDLQIIDGDLVIEDGDLLTVPRFREEDIPKFIKWYNSKKENSLELLSKNGIEMKQEENHSIQNNGNLIINNNTKIKNQSLNSSKETLQKNKKRTWSKADIIALIVGIFTIIGILHQIGCF